MISIPSNGRQLLLEVEGSIESVAVVVRGAGDMCMCAVHSGQPAGVRRELGKNTLEGALVGPEQSSNTGRGKRRFKETRIHLDFAFEHFMSQDVVEISIIGRG